MISPQQSPVPLLKFQMTPRFKILMSSGYKKETQIYYPFHSKSPGKRIPSRFSNGDPMERDTRLQGIFYVSLNLSRFIIPSESLLRDPPHSMFPNRVPMDRNTLSPEPLVYLFIHSFMYFCRSLWKATLLHAGKNIRSPSTEPYADRRLTYSGVWPGSPRSYILLMCIG
jgi:hypothetical protein